MQWLVTNWFWLLIGIAFVAMHLFAHGGHAGHGGGNSQPAGKAKAGEGSAPDANRSPSGHQH